MNELLNLLAKNNTIHSYIIDPDTQLVAIRLHENGPLHEFSASFEMPESVAIRQLRSEILRLKTALNVAYGRFAA